MINPDIEYFFVEENQNKRKAIWLKNTISDQRECIAITQHISDFYQNNNFKKMFYNVLLFVLKITPITLYSMYIGLWAANLQIINIFLVGLPESFHLKTDWIFLGILVFTLFLILPLDDENPKARQQS